VGYLLEPRGYLALLAQAICCRVVVVADHILIQNVKFKIQNYRVFRSQY
jgi:hypothetical protein